MKATLFLMSIFLSAAAVLAQVPDAPVPFLSMAHRGDPKVQPENTIPGFKSAIATGVDSCEFDVYSTKDGVLVISHDNDLKRTTHGACSKKITESNWSEIKTIDVGVWKGEKFKGITIPTLDETLDLFKNSGCVPVIEVKQPGTEERIVTALKKRNMIRECAIVSFHYKSLVKMTELAPEIYVIRNGGDRKNRTDEEYVQYFKDSFKNGGFKVANPFYTNLNENTIKRLHEEGFRVGSWVINDEKTLNKFLDWGINSITTDNPALLVKVIQERKNKCNNKNK